MQRRRCKDKAAAELGRTFYRIMHSSLGQLRWALGIGGLMSLYGVVSLIIWVGGERLRTPYSYRIVFIAVILLTLPFVLFIAFVSSRRKKKKERLAQEAKDAANQASEQSAAAPAQKVATPVAADSDMSKGAEEVVQFLKTSNLGESGKDAVYSLPWYVVAGTPKSGKSSLVIGSNLNFQTLGSQRQSEQKFIRPTGSVDWRVTSDAVFVDTAGRYQTEGVDGEEWASLVETIKKYRANRPIDGFLLVASTEKILKSNEREIEEMAKTLRARLDDVIQRLKVRFPVYVVFTNADAIEGFRDSFSTSKGEDKTLVWGATIPLEKSENAQALFDGEYEVLHNSVMKRRLIRLSAPFPPVRQLRIFNFPLHFGSARRKIGAFVSTLFRPNPFSENPFLRGFYFTSSPAGRAGSNSPQTVDNTYFTQRFFRDVVLRDKDLVKTFLAQRQRPPIFGWFLTLLGAFLTLALLVMAGISLLTNRQMLAEATDKGERLLTISKTDAFKNPFQQNEKLARDEMNATDDLRGLLVKLDDYERNGAPFYMRFGLYSGNRIYKQHLLPIYMGVIEHRFKGATVTKVEADLRKFAASQPVANPGQLTAAEEENLGKHYDLLKAYLMLTGEYKQKAEASHLANTLKDYWTTESKVPEDLKLTAQQQLDFWAKQVDRDDDEYRFPRISPDTKLIEDARKKLLAFPAWQRYYKRKVTDISKELDAVTVDTILTNNGADPGLVEGTYRVPSAFTRTGLELMKTAIAEADQKLSEDDWVMDETGKNAVAQATDAGKIEERYYRDYAEAWRNFVKGISVKRYANPAEAANALQSFSTLNSPMRILMIEVAKNTNLSAPLEGAGWWEWIKSLVSSKTSTDTGGGTAPEKEFRPLFAFVGKKDQKDVSIDKYQGEMGRIFNQINGRSAEEFREYGKQMATENKDPIKLRDRETAVSNLIKGFNETPSSQDLALLLQQPLGNLRTLLEGEVRGQLAKVWADQILPAAKEVEKGYPFDDSQSEADLTKLTAFLNPVDGSLTKFYNERLKMDFEEADGLVKVKDSAKGKYTDEFVAYLNNALNLRKALFGTNPTPKFEYEFTLNPVKDAIVEVSIDGQKASSEGTGSLKATFPGPSSAETGVLMSLGSTSGTTSTSGSTPSANNSNSSVNTSSNTANRFLQGSTASSSGCPPRCPGTWGLFRFVDAGRPQKQAGGEYSLSYNISGKSVTATIKTSGGDLFDKAIFRQMKAPQSFLK